MGYQYFLESALIKVPKELLHTAMGGTAPRELAFELQETESTVRSLRSTQAVLSRREEILRYDHPTPKVLLFQEHSNGALEEAVKDYVSGMTDRYALAQAEEMHLL